MSTAYTAGMPTRRRRQRRALTILALAVLLIALIVGAFHLTSKLRDDSPTTPATTAACVAPPAGITVNVLNATSRIGLARVAADAMRTQKFDVGDASNAPAGTQVDGVAEIRHGAAAAEGAALLARYLPGAVLKPVDRADTTVELVLGQRFQTVQAPSSPC